MRRLLLPRLILVNVERANGRWHWTLGLHWPCGCSHAGTAYTPWKALRLAAEDHTYGQARSRA